MEKHESNEAYTIMNLEGLTDKDFDKWLDDAIGKPVMAGGVVVGEVSRTVHLVDTKLVKVYISETKTKTNKGVN